MDNRDAMRGLEAECHLAKHVHRVGNGQPSLLQALLERLALVERDRDEQLAVLLAEFVNRPDVRMVERAGGPRFAQESSLGVLAGGKLSRQQLDRHGPTELEVRRSIDNPHPTRPQPRLHPVVRQNAPGEQVDFAGSRNRLFSDSGELSAGYRHEAARLLVRREQLFDFLLQLAIPTASLREEAVPRDGVPLKCGVEQPLHLLPMLGCHQRAPPVTALPPFACSSLRTRAPRSWSRHRRPDISAPAASEEARCRRASPTDYGRRPGNDKAAGATAIVAAATLW